jgi:DNA-binding transcriptional LysR family regulator
VQHRIVYSIRKILSKDRAGSTLLRRDIVELVLSGEADLGLTTEVGSRHAEHLTTLPVFTLSRSLITAAGHPLLRRKRPSLEEIAAYPLIVYDNKLTAGRTVAQAFRRPSGPPSTGCQLFRSQNGQVVRYRHHATGRVLTWAPVVGYRRH